MSAPKRKREVQLNFRVSPEELALIEQKMAQLGTKNREAYLRKMALDGYVVRLELSELKELVSLMRYSSNNLNQLARRVQAASPGLPLFSLPVSLQTLQKSGYNRYRDKRIPRKPRS